VVSTPTGYALLGNVRQDGSSPPVILSGSSDGRSWNNVDASAFGPGFSAIAASPLGWVASAQIDAGAPSAGTRSVLWFSTDGISWQQLPDQAGLAHMELDASSGTLSAGPPGFAITGSVITAGNSGPAAWISRDGRTWTRVDAQGGTGFERILVLPSGFVGLASSVGSAEFSTDGTSWRDLSKDPDSPFGPNSRSAFVTSVGSTVIVLRYGPTGALEIFGGDLGNGAGSTHVSWHHNSTADAAFAGTDASAAATSSAGALVLGYDLKSLAPIAWTSADGLAWRRTALDPATFGGGVPGLIAGSSTGVASFVAIGARVNSAGVVRPQIWRSDDGTAWSAAGGDILGVLPAAPTGPCPATTPTAVEDFLAMAPSLWPVCFGSRTLKVRGYIADCGGCGGATNEQASPTWLLDPLGYSAFWLSPAVVQADTGHGGFGVMINPAHPVTVPSTNTHVELSGHFDDPAATTCRVWSGGGPVLPRDQTVAACKQAFVVTAIRKLPA